jgi:hypothetical protein
MQLSTQPAGIIRIPIKSFCNPPAQAVALALRGKRRRTSPPASHEPSKDPCLWGNSPQALFFTPTKNPLNWCVYNFGVWTFHITPSSQKDRLAARGVDRKEQSMNIPANGWSNKRDAGDRPCKCGTWKEHWLNFSGEPWPENCSVHGCPNTPTLGAHIANPSLFGERIVPMCSSCNELGGSFNLKVDVTLPRANTVQTSD